MAAQANEPTISARLILAGFLGLITLLIAVIIVLIALDTGASRAQGYTVSPAFDDPRLSITVAYPFRGANGPNPTALPWDYLPEVLQAEFGATRGVQACTLYLSSITDIMGSCTVDERLNTVEMAELLRLLGNQHVAGITLDLVLNDGVTETRYAWRRYWFDEWQIAPITHPAFDDPRLSLIVATNPPVNLFQTIPPTTPDPRPYDERIITAFEDTPGVHTCTVTLEDNPNPPSRYGAGQTGLVIVNAECAVEPTYNMVLLAEWLRRLANRALLDSNALICEDMWMCEGVLALPVMNLVLDDGDASTAYAWNGRGWVITVGE